VIINRYCFDPFGSHKKKSTTSLACVSEKIKLELAQLGIQSHTGQKVCRNCITKVQSVLGANRSYASMELDGDYQPTPTSNRLHLEESLQSVNTSISDFTTPIKASRVAKMSTEKRSLYIYKKLSTVSQGLEAKLREITGSELITEKEEFTDIADGIKSKMVVGSRMEQVKLLTLLPDHWSREKIVKDFPVSERQVKEARQLKAEQGILPNVSRSRKGNKVLDTEIEKAVIEYYKHSEMVRIMPGTK
jgi:hypothetical protein